MPYVLLNARFHLKHFKFLNLEIACFWCWVFVNVAIKLSDLISILELSATDHGLTKEDKRSHTHTHTHTHNNYMFAHNSVQENEMPFINVLFDRHTHNKVFEFYNCKYTLMHKFATYFSCNNIVMHALIKPISGSTC